MKRVVSIVALLACAISIESQAAEDTCAEDGGSAACVGPAVGPYRYQVSNGGGYTRGTEEAPTVAAFTQLLRDNFRPCTFNVSDNLPPRPPARIGAGNASEGSYANALLYGIGQYWSLSWALSTERRTERIPIVYSGTYPIDGVGAPACSRSFGPFGAYIERVRTVECPAGYKDNTTAPSHAYCYRASPTRDPVKNLGGQCGNVEEDDRRVLVGNPVNPATGNKFQSETDYQGQGSTPLKFIRYYNSYAAQYYAPGSTMGLNSSLGPSWRSSYERLLRYADSIRFPTVHAYRPDGRTLHFKLVNGQFVGDADIADRLVRLVDSSGNPTGWQYTIAGREEVEIYDDSGRLLSIRSRGGIVQTLQYDSGGRLGTVTDSFGHQLGFTYDTNGRLATLTDPTTQTLTYTYNSVGNVDSVTYADGRTRTYVYNEPANTQNKNYPYALTGIIDEAQNRFSTYTYDGVYQRVLSTEHAGGVEKYTFYYPSTLMTQATITDPLLQQRTHTFTTLHGMAKTTAISQPCTSCGGAGAAATSYDANGNTASRTDFNGNKICYAYDLSRNLETIRLEGVAPGLSCPADLASYTPAAGTRQRKIATQWHVGYRLPTQVDELGKRTTFTHDASGNVSTQTLLDTSTSESRTWTYTYNGYGQVLTMDGRRGC